MDDKIKELKEQYGDKLIIRHGKPIGVCECKGKGAGRCGGGGFEKFIILTEEKSDYKKCTKIQDIP